MSYTKHIWVNDHTPAINAPHLNEMEAGIKANDMRAAANETAIHNLGAGHGAALRGSKALSDIYTVTGQVNDIYINNDKSTPTFGHAYISDGQGAGASHWKDIGQLIGDKGNTGPAGPRGLMGLGLHFEHAYADKAAMVAANPHPELGDVHLTIDSGNLWVYDNPNPPHTAANANWHGVGHVQGPKGDTGSQGPKGDTGAQGQPGSALQLATQAETDAGTVANKAVTPHALHNTPTLVHVLPTGVATIKGTGNSTLEMYKGSTKYTAMVSYSTSLEFGVGAPETKYRFSNNNATIGGGYLIATNKSDNDWYVGRANALGLRFTSVKSTAYIELSDTGDINLSPKAGKKVRISGATTSSVVTGSLSGTTLTLTI